MTPLELQEARHRTTVCFANQKGGCGKSSTCFHLAGHFAQKGRPILLVDADPQGSLSQGFFGSELVECLELSETTAVVFRKDVFQSAQSVVAPTAFDGISVVRANQHLADHNNPRPETSGMQQYALKSFLNTLHGYDLTFVDCPPNLYSCTWNALVAADYVVVPVPPEDFGTHGLRTVLQAINNARLLNPRLQLLGLLVTRYDSRLLVHQTYEQELRELYGCSVLETIIPEASAFKVSLACRKPVSFYAPRSKAARLTENLAREILARIHQDTAERSVA